MAKGVDYSASIIEINKALATKYSRNAENREFWADDARVLELLKMCQNVYYSQIHDYLDKNNNDRSEEQIRKLCADLKANVFPIVKERRSELKKTIEQSCRKVGLSNLVDSLDGLINQKSIERFNNELLRECERIKNKYNADALIDIVKQIECFIGYNILVDDMQALISFRDLMEFAMFMEKDLPKERQIITMAHDNGLIQPVLYTSQQMILTGAVKKLFKNTPTGYFKSYSDIIIISWICGYNFNADCLKVVGNPKMVTKTINGVSNMMLMQRYAKVFPFYQQYECNPQQMFKILAPRSGEMLLAHAQGIDFSLLCISKETPIDGGRYKYRFYDDITNSKYKTNITMHDSDDNAYNDQWKKRRYTEFDDCEWFTGTVYYYLDFLSRRRNENGFALAVPLKQFKYTKFCKEKKSVFVVIPKLDYDTDECTFPQIYSTEQARIDRSNDFATFQAMEQGLPTIPDGMPFDYSNMKVWKELPLKESEGGTRSDYTYGALDLPRTGDNNLSLMVLSPCGELHYLVDGIYEKKPIDYKFENGKTMLDLVCEKIKARNMKHLVAETNVCSNIKTQIEEKLEKLHHSCKIYEVYSTMKKEDKIFNCQSDIQQHIVIPASGIFGLSSDVGRAVFEIVTWNTKAKSDDSIDTISMYVRQFVNQGDMSYATIGSFRR